MSKEKLADSLGNTLARPEDGIPRQLYNLHRKQSHVEKNSGGPGGI